MFIQLRSSEEDHKNIVEQGFTLIELLVVIVILGILAAVVLFALGGLDSSAKKNSCSTEAATVQTAIAAFRAAHPTIPIVGKGAGFSGAATQQSVVADLTQSATGVSGYTSTATPATAPNPNDNGVAIQALLQTIPKQNAANGYWQTTGTWDGTVTTPYWQIANPNSSNPTVQMTAGCTQ